MEKSSRQAAFADRVVDHSIHNRVQQTKMFQPKLLPLLVVLAIGLPTGALGLLPPHQHAGTRSSGGLKSSQLSRPRHSYRRWAVGNDKGDKLDNNNAPPVVNGGGAVEALLEQQDVQSSQQAAKDALVKLRDRQLRELGETQRLLELVTEDLDHHDTSSSSSTSLSTAASILAGVDYGFISRSEGATPTLQGGLEALAHQYPGPPSNIWTIGSQQFVRNLRAMKGEYRDEPETHLTDEQVKLQESLQQLTLNSTAIWEREFADGPLQAPWIIKLPYLAICYLLDVIFEGRYVPSRFHLLETVARMPYFSYSTCQTTMLP